MTKPTKKGIDWSKKDMYEGLGREDLKPKSKSRPKPKTLDEIVGEFEKALEVPSGAFINKRFIRGYETAKADAKDFLRSAIRQALEAVEVGEKKINTFLNS